jgi:hypothetical protein
MVEGAIEGIRPAAILRDAAFETPPAAAPEGRGFFVSLPIALA